MKRRSTIISLIILWIVANSFILGVNKTYSQASYPVPLPKTGQVTSYRAGDDGDLQMGVSWPDPRFTDNGDGTVTDNLTGLMWTKDANIWGQLNWNAAIDNCNAYSLAGYDDWRLPNLRELLSLVDYSQIGPALPNNHPFINVNSSGYYSSSTSHAKNPSYHWALWMWSSGTHTDGLNKLNSYNIWPVRGTTTGAEQAPLPQTGQVTSYRTGDDGDLQKGVSWPDPRFTDNGDGTVTDNLTGLMWTKDANIWDVTNWFDAIDNCSEYSLAGHDDWRLPNMREIQSIYDYSKAYPSPFGGTPFIGVDPNKYYWSSTSFDNIGANSRCIVFYDGELSSITHADLGKTWPVRNAIPKVHIIHTSSNSGGTLFPEGNINVDHGSNVTIDIVPDPGYIIDDVLVDSFSVGVLSTYTFTSVETDHNFQVIFYQLLAPDANAGPDQNVAEYLIVTLDGSGSTDPDDGIVTYEWTQLGDSTVTLSNKNEVQPTFTSPNVGPDGEALTFQLTVTDSYGLQDTDTCIVNVTWLNEPPLANAGADQTVTEATTVSLDGSNSNDPDDGVASYKWVQTAGPTVSLSDDTLANPSFQAPGVTSAGATITFELTVTDHGGLKSQDICNVTVQDDPSACNSIPEKPILLSPGDGLYHISLTPLLTIESYVDLEQCSNHFKTRWQISKRPNFNGLTLNANSILKDLTSHQVSPLVLEPETTYYWRVKYWGNHGNQSDWSDTWTFTTGPEEDDTNGNGIPDDSEVDDFIDMDDDGTPDNEQPDKIKTIRSKKGNVHIGVKPNKGTITQVKAIDAGAIPDGGGKPNDIPNGLVAFRIETQNLGDEVTVNIYLSRPLKPWEVWYKYDPINGWYDFSEHTQINKDRNIVTLTLKDGGFGDGDYVANGIIVDPSGVVEPESIPVTGGVQCFIGSLLH